MARNKADISHLPGSSEKLAEDVFGFHVAIVDGSGNQITTFGGGTQYTEGDADTTITGTALLWEDTSDTLRAVSAAKPLPVNIVSGAGSGGTASTDDAAFTAAAGSGTPAMGFVTSDVVDSGDVGVLRMTATRDLNVTIRDSAGDNAMDDANNALRVNVVAGSAGGPSKTDDSAFTVATDSVAPTGFLADETATDTVDEGDVGIARMDTSRRVLTRIVGATDANRLDIDASGRATVVVGTALPAGTNNIGDVDVLSVPAPLSTTGGGTEATALRVTVANDSTGVLSVDDNGGSLTVDGTVAVSGTVTVDSELPTAAALADDTANPTVPGVGAFGMVYDGTTWDRLRGTSADGVLVNLGANNDVTVTSGSITVVDGGSSISVDDNGSTLSIDDGAGSITIDNAALSVTGGGVEASALRVTIATDSTGVLSVDDNGSSITVDNAGTFAVQVDGAALTALQLIDDPVFADDAAFTLASSKVSMAGAIRDDALSTLTAVEGDAVPLRVSSTGALHVTGGGGGTEYTVNAAAPADPTGGASLMERDDALSSLTEIEGDWTNMRANARGALWVELDTTNSVPVTNTVLSVVGGGTEAAAQRVTIASDSTGVLSVDDNGASLTVDGTVTANQGTAGTAWEVVGDVAQDVAIAGNPLPTGLRASDAEPTAMSADGDAVYAWGDRSGRFVTTMKCGSTAQSSVAGSASSVALLASNVARLGAVINNDSTAVLYVKLGATASTTSYTYKLYTDGVCEIPYGYTGAVDGIWSSATGNARLTEFS